MSQSDYEQGILEDVSDPVLECTKCGEQVDNCEMCNSSEFQKDDEVYCGICHGENNAWGHICKKCFNELGIKK